MQQRDLIKDEIEQLGRAIGKLIANFLGFKTEGNVKEGIQITNNVFQTELDIDVDKLICLQGETLVEYINVRNLSALHLDQLASYLYEVSIEEKSADGDYKKWAITAKKLLDIVGEKSDTITFGRIDLIKKLNRIIE